MPTSHEDAAVLTASREALESFRDDIRYLWCTDIPVYENPPSAIDFLRNHVAVSRPCIVRNAILDHKHEPLHVTLDDLVQASAQQEQKLELHVDVTPDGHGDCLRRVEITSDPSSRENTSSSLEDGTQQQVFVKPLEIKMSISSFVKHLRKGRQARETTTSVESSSRVFTTIPSRINDDDDNNKYQNLQNLNDCVLYYSRQNDCLRQELDFLWKLKTTDGDDTTAVVTKEETETSYLFPRSFSWAEQAFGLLEPEAVNLWLGDQRAVSFLHKDFYENLFYVLSGEKVFHLVPPGHAPLLPEQPFPSGRFALDRHNDEPQDNAATKNPWVVQMDPDPEDPHKTATTHWVAADVFGTRHNSTSSSSSSFSSSSSSLLEYAHSLPNIRVRAGEILYLPSLWYHQVTQSCESVGINYWYDMKFDSPLYCYFHFLQQLSSESASNSTTRAQEAT